jgi:diguanylate cyclase (GGDEF)-like protein
MRRPTWRRGTVVTSLRTRLVAVLVLLVGVIASIMLFSQRASSAEHNRAIIDNVAGRQPALLNRYAKEVLLVTAGVQADPQGTSDQLLATGDALLFGGKVLAVQGNDAEVSIPRETDATVRAKLMESNRLAHVLVDQGTHLMAERPGDPTFNADADTMEATSQVAENVAHDAVGRMSDLADAAVSTETHRAMALAGIGIVLAAAFVWMLSRDIVRRLRALAAVATSAAAGDLTVRHGDGGHDEIGAVGTALNNMIDSLAGLLARLEAEAVRDGFGTQLVEALEMADDEREAYEVTERAMARVQADLPMELLLADSSNAHLHRAATHPLAGRAGCPVESPYRCVAVRRGNAVVFESSSALNACPRLLEHAGGACSAVCVPVTFMGRALGVLHAVGPDGEPPSSESVAQLTTLALQAGARIGTVRAFAASQLQASTDGLTGLMNRRTFDDETGRLLSARRPFALAMVDLDHFKELNDTYGHEAGDRALRIFSQIVTDTAGPDAVIGRYGGEEFAVLFPGQTSGEAAVALERVRDAIATGSASSGGAAFTASFGVTDSTHGASLEELYRSADRALRLAKAAGRDRVVVSGVATGADAPPAADSSPDGCSTPDSSPAGYSPADSSPDGHALAANGTDGHSTADGGPTATRRQRTAPRQ